MSHYVYIIRRELDGTYYKGYCRDYQKRLTDHNAGLSTYTAARRPWKLIYVEQHLSKTNALIRERKLKKCKAEYFEWLIKQPTNIIATRHGLG